eukprot:COSAG02_NODE_24832_length_676_cov_1.088388_1_plen_114_part_10
MAQGLLRSQREGKLGPIKLRLVQCTLDEEATNAFSQLEQVPPPPLPDSSPGEDYETGGIPICINDEWYRLGSYQARFAAADMVTTPTLCMTTQECPRFRQTQTFLDYRSPPVRP